MSRVISEFRPTPEQEIALTHPAPLLALAGAGTGKTTVLTRRIARTIAEGVARPDEILALTFTDKAAAEMAERLAEVLGESGRAEAAREVTVGTFHAFGGLVIREHLLELGFPRTPAVVTSPGAWQLLASIFDELTFDQIEIATGALGMVFGHLLHLFSQCKDHLVSPDDLERYAAELDTSGLPPAGAAYLEGRMREVREVAAAYRRYEETKRERCLIDFGDHLYLPVRLFGEHPEIRDAYRRRFRSIYVDEYQDTNHAQRQLLLELLDPAHPEIMVIGDDDQAIYRWRGAVVQNILHFHEESVFDDSHVKVKLTPLTLNRRSLPPILDLANLAISEVQERHQKALAYHEANREERGFVGHYLAASDRREGEWIARRIGELVPEARSLQGKKRGYGAFAVLCRKRRLFETVGEALEKAGIPYELIGGTGFYGRWEIRDILSYLRILADPADDLALARILRSRRFRLSGRDLFHLSSWVHHENGDRGRASAGRAKVARLHLLDAVLEQERVRGLSPEARVRLSALRDELRGYERDRQRLPLPDLVTEVVERAGYYRRELRARVGFDARVALLNLEKLEEMARQFAKGAAGASLKGFVEFVRYALESGEEEGEVRPVDESTDTVKVMTVHQAKGLEFPIVFVPGLAERVFPSSRRDESDKWYEVPADLRGDRDYLPKVDLGSAKTDRDLKRVLGERKEAEKALQLDEERRLFYVALTRAQHQLYLSRAHWYGATAKPREPSPFWELVVGSGLSESLGEEECPADNPSVGASADAEPEREDTASRSDGLDAPKVGTDPTDWVEATARSEGYGRWTVLRAAVDSHLASLGLDDEVQKLVEKVDVSCSGLLLYLACPRHYRYVYVDRLPTRPSPWARLGEEIHRRIEELSRPEIRGADRGAGQGSPDEPEPRPTEEQVEAIVEEVLIGREATAGERAELSEMLARYRASVYGRRRATHVELPFALGLPSGVLRGRIDRLDRLSGAEAGLERWEVIDYKSGKPSLEALEALEAKEAYRLQLGLYALAVRETLGVPAARLTAHLLFLRDGSDLAITFDDSELDQVRDQADAAMLAIARGDFPTRHDSAHCAGCDYTHLCLTSQTRTTTSGDTHP